MDRGHDGRRIVDQPGLDEQRQLEIGVAAALAEANTRAIDRDRAADDEIDVPEVVNAGRDALG